MIYLILLIVLSAACGLLFYLKHKRRSNKQGENMADYGVEVSLEDGNVVNLTNRSVMVLDIFEIVYGQNGSKVFHRNISTVTTIITSSNYIATIGKYGKMPIFRIDGKKLSWEWIEARHFSSSNMSVIVFAE